MGDGVVRFLGFDLDPARRELRHNGEVSHVEPQVFDVLAYLVAHRDRVVTKVELLDEVWGSRFVSESALTSRIKSARQAIGDSGREQAAIRTVHGRGYRFVAPTGDGAEPGQAPSTGPGLVARAFHLDRLATRFAEASAGSRQAVFVTGEAGIGKTSLVDAFVAGLDGTDAVVARGRCLDQRGLGEPYLPIFDSLGRLCRGPHGAATVDVLASAAPSWLLQMPSLVAGDRLDDLRARSLGASGQRMLRELVDAIELLAVSRPLVLVVDDLHWCDESTTNVLDALARRRDSARLLILGTYRPGAAGADGRVPETARELVREGLAEELVLDRLGRQDVAALVQDGRPGLPEAVVELLHARTAGVPLFVRELVMSWTGTGVLAAGDDGRWRSTVPLEELARAVPDSVPTLVERELTRLEPDELALLEAAAVVGDEFSSAAAAAVAGTADDVLESGCAALARRHLFLAPEGVDEWPDGTVSGRFRFLHQLHHQVLYDRVPPGRRVRSHLAAGERLERAYTDRAGEHLGELALHFDRGREPIRASEYLAGSAQQAIVRGAYPEALAHLDAALVHAGRRPPGAARDQCLLALHLARGSALIPTRGWTAPDLEDTYRRAADLSEQLDDPLARQLVAVALATVHEIRGRHQESEAMLGSFVGAQAEALVPEVHELLACAAFHLGKYEQAIEHATRGLTRFRHDPPNELYARFGVDPAVFAHAWAAFSSWFLGRSADAAGHIREATDGNATRAYAMASASVLAACFHQYRNEPGAVLDWSENAIAFATEQGFPFPLAEAHVLRGWARVVGEGADDGLAELTAGMEAYRASGARSDIPHYLGLRADCLLRCGRGTEALTALDEALAQVRGMAGYFHEPELHRLRALALLADAGDGAMADARATLVLGLAQAEAQRSAPMRLRLLLSLHDLADDGPQVVARLVDALTVYPADDDAPDVARARALLASGLERTR